MPFRSLFCCGESKDPRGKSTGQNYRDAIDGVWAQWKEGQINEDQARQQVSDLTGGFRAPDWFAPDLVGERDSAGNAAVRERDDAGEPPVSGVQRGQSGRAGPRGSGERAGVPGGNQSVSLSRADIEKSADFKRHSNQLDLSSALVIQAVGKANAHRALRGSCERSVVLQLGCGSQGGGVDVLYGAQASIWRGGVAACQVPCDIVQRVEDEVFAQVHLFPAQLPAQRVVFVGVCTGLV